MCRKSGYLIILKLIFQVGVRYILKNIYYDVICMKSGYLIILKLIFQVGVRYIEKYILGCNVYEVRSYHYFETHIPGGSEIY